MFATDTSMSVVELAREAEARGFQSLYLPEHTHIPVERRTPPPTGDRELADEYKRTLDPLVALAAAATATEQIRLGTGIALPAQREPIVTAKAIATLDQLSGGRFVFGIGFGWNEDELEDHGVSMKQRRDVVREDNVLRHGALALDPLTRSVTKDGQPVDLSAREFALLAALLERPGAALSKAQLEERIYRWGDEVESNAVEVHVHNLRKKLGNETIRTLRGIGYALA